jgi:hypothetical protein
MKAGVNDGYDKDATRTSKEHLLTVTVTQAMTLCRAPLQL